VTPLTFGCASLTPPPPHMVRSRSCLSTQATLDFIARWPPRWLLPRTIGRVHCSNHLAVNAPPASSRGCPPRFVYVNSLRSVPTATTCVLAASLRRKPESHTKVECAASAKEFYLKHYGQRCRVMRIILIALPLNLVWSFHWPVVLTQASSLFIPHTRPARKCFEWKGLKRVCKWISPRVQSWIVRMDREWRWKGEL